MNMEMKSKLKGKIVEKGIKFYEDFASDLKLKWSINQHRCSNCPFCKTNTDDCFHANRHLYYCYECHAQGDPINYLLQTRKADYKSVFITLAMWSGLNLPEDTLESRALIPIK